MTHCPYGFRILGPPWEARRLVNITDALAAYAACDVRAEINQESHLSAFQFGDDFSQLLRRTRSTAGFSGICWSSWLWIDIDAEGDLERARREAAQLVSVICDRYGCSGAKLLIFFSGAKGFHIGLPTTLWLPKPSTDFNRIARRAAESLAELATVGIDVGVYDKVRPLRAPNSRHPKTGLHKRHLTRDELDNLTMETIRELAREPTPFAIPSPVGTNSQAIADWSAAADLVSKGDEAKVARRVGGNCGPTLNRATLDFIQHEAAPGERAKRLFSAAANLGEFSCAFDLAWALLSEAALDSGLQPFETRRQIQCGLEREF